MAGTVIDAIHVHVNPADSPFMHVMTLIDGQYMEVLYTGWDDILMYIRLLEILGKRYTVFVR